MELKDFKKKLKIKLSKKEQMEIDFSMLVKNFRIKHGMTKQQFAKFLRLPLKIIKHIEENL